MNFNNLSKEIKHILFTNRCAVCRKVVENKIYICDDCKKFLSRTNENFIWQEHIYLSQIFFDDIISPFYYDNASKNAMLNMKFRKIKEICDFFGEEMAENIFHKYTKADFDYIVYVPTTKLRLRERGFNPPYEMAEKIREISKISILKDLFNRNNQSKTQHSLDYSERVINANKSYSINIDKLNGKNFLLIDDICTSGATLNSLSRLLKENGAEKVICSVGCIGNKII